MEKCATGDSFQLCSCKTLQNFVPFVYFMLLNLIHKLKSEANLALLST